jgi:hypothetical protein
MRPGTCRGDNRIGNGTIYSFPVGAGVCPERKEGLMEERDLEVLAGLTHEYYAAA